MRRHTGVMCLARSVDEVSGQSIHVGGDVGPQLTPWFRSIGHLQGHAFLALANPAAVLVRLASCSRPQCWCWWLHAAVFKPPTE